MNSGPYDTRQHLLFTPPTHFFSQHLHGSVTNGVRAKNKCKCHMLCWRVETREESQKLTGTFRRSPTCIQPPQANSCSAILRRQSSLLLQEERFVINKQCWSSQRLIRSKTMSFLCPYFPSAAEVVPLPAVAGTGRVRSCPRAQLVAGCSNIPFQRGTPSRKHSTGQPRNEAGGETLL